MEELTFQFSGNVEAAKKRSEEQIALSMESTKKDISISQVSSILRLMEGNDVYDRLRMHATIFANAFANNPETSAHSLSLDALEPSQRYTALLLTLDVLEKSGRTAAASQLKNKHENLTPENDIPDHLQKVALASQTENIDEQLQISLQDSFYNLISAKPTLDSVIDTANQLTTLENFGKALNEMQTAFGSAISQNQLRLIGSTIIVCRLINVVRTMIAFTEDILKKMGLQDIKNKPATLKHTQSLIKLAASSAPSSLLDKLASAVLSTPRRCPKCSRGMNFFCHICKQKKLDCTCNLSLTPCTCPDAKVAFFSLLHQHIHHWPDAVWTATEGNKLLREQLVRKQHSMNHIYRILSR
jgi:hypothetical protein